MKEPDKLRLIEEMKGGDEGALQEVLQGLTEELTEAGWDKKSARLDAIGWLATRLVLDSWAVAIPYDAKRGVQEAKRSKDAPFKHSWVARVVNGSMQGMAGPMLSLMADEEVATHVKLRLAWFLRLGVGLLEIEKGQAEEDRFLDLLTDDGQKQVTSQP